MRVVPHTIISHIVFHNNLIKKLVKEISAELKFTNTPACIEFYRKWIFDILSAQGQSKPNLLKFRIDTIKYITSQCDINDSAKFILMNYVGRLQRYKKLKILYLDMFIY
jgi:hypothetical protein